MAKKQIVIADIDEEINRALSVYEFWEFCLYYDNQFFSERPFLQKVADAFQQVYTKYSEGIAITAAISMPPRAGKSYITSLFCAWWLGKFPTVSVMRNTCTSSLYKKFSYDIRKIIRSSRYRAVFPKIALSSDKQNLQGWNLTTAKQVSYFGAGTGGTIIGFGANLAVTDDLYRDLDDALNENYNEGVIRWKESAHDSRKEKNCPELFIGTRWTTKDVIGKALEEGNISIKVEIAALDDNDNSFCENVKTTEEYRKVKRNIDQYIWEAEYMQRPTEKKGLLFPISSLNFTYNESKSNIKDKIEHSMCQVDPADRGGDDLSAPFGKLVGKYIYIDDVIYNNEGTDINEVALLEKVISNKATAVRFEANGGWFHFGSTVRNRLEDRGVYNDFNIYNQSRNKYTRILAQAAFIKNYFVFREDWETYSDDYRKFIKNLTSYYRVQSGNGTNAHDDAPDSLAGMADYFLTNFEHLWR